MRLVLKVAIAGLMAAVVWAQTESKKPEMEHVVPALNGDTLSTYCAVCHGKAADGRGPMAATLKSHVPNLTEISKRNGGTFPSHEFRKLWTAQNRLADWE